MVKIPINIFTSFLFFILFLSSFCAGAQNLFEEKFEGCDTSHFVMESDSVSVRIRGAEVLSMLATNFEEEVVNRIRGELALQVLVDLDGNSCLLSVENSSNVATELLHLKEIIDRQLKWETPTEKTAAILAMRFHGKTAEIKRIGLNGEKGFHELRE